MAVFGTTAALFTAGRGMTAYFLFNKSTQKFKLLGFSLPFLYKKYFFAKSDDFKRLLLKLKV